MKKVQKQIIQVRSKDFDIDTDTIEQAIKKLTQFQESIGKDTFAYIDFNTEFDCDTKFKIIYSREETDDEYVKRIDAENLEKKIRREKYEQLKKEFENE